MSLVNIKSHLLQLCTFIFAIIFLFILYDGIFHPYPMYNQLNPLIVLSGIIILLAVFYGLIKVFLKLDRKYLWGISVINFIIIIFLQWIFLTYFKVNPSWDFGMVYNGALSQLDDFNYLSYYFVGYYPNNIPLLVIELYILRLFKLVGITDYLSGLIVINAFLILLSLLGAYYLIYKRYGIQIATLFTFFFLIITPFYAYVPIVYTDTFAMIFPIGALIIYYKLLTSLQKKYFLIAILGVWLALGTLVKTNVVIILIAIIIHYFMTQSFKNWIKFTGIICISFLITNFSYQLFISPHNSMPKGESGLPATHWIMMGLNNPGGYDEADAQFSINLKNTEHSTSQIKEKNINIIKERLQDYGIGGLIDHLKQKINFTWSDGTYYSLKKLIREPLMDDNPFAPYILGEKNGPFIYLSQISHLTLLTLIFFSSLGLLRKKDIFEYLLCITTIGVFLFLLLWETRSRYLLLYLPTLLVLAGYGMNYIKLLHSRPSKKKI